MNRSNITAFGGLLVLLLVMAGVLFLSAGTLDYWHAWAFLFAFGAPALAITVYLVRNDPKLLARRVHAGPTAEKEKSQQIIQSITSVGFLAMLVVPALDHRFGWSRVPLAVVLAGDILIALGFLVIYFVYRENSFASAIIEVAPEQTVISSGPYALVRHPMYLGGLVLFLGIPLALGSWWGLGVLVLMMPALIWRLLDEEQFLAKNLPGYAAYRSKVRYRLVPFIF